MVPTDGPRVPPLPEQEWDATARELLDGVRRDPGGQVPHIFATLVRHPELFARFLPLGGQLLGRSRFPARTRELLILRTAANCGADYEWGRHVPIAGRAGLSDEDVARILAGPDAPGWDASDALLLRAADELHGRHRIADGTWEALRDRYDVPDLIELTMLVGEYHMIAFTLNSLGVQLDPGFSGLPDGADA